MTDVLGGLLMGSIKNIYLRLNLPVAEPCAKASEAAENTESKACEAAEGTKNMGCEVVDETENKVFTSAEKPAQLESGNFKDSL
ncbi:hypothetical protein LPJ66_000888 [Kickxella alabastrina]|uniref:Uncharacterized protein n=1 Tax=Kickxella alabastrina TaxID=61397 RepID=A0ACC1IUV0_9FUNG|nr:hypothetical protein LPJ66_000888 [Kickxella alabastrina]